MMSSNLRPGKVVRWSVGWGKGTPASLPPHHRLGAGSLLLLGLLLLDLDQLERHRGAADLDDLLDHADLRSEIVGDGDLLTFDLQPLAGDGDHVLVRAGGDLERF